MSITADEIKMLEMLEGDGNHVEDIDETVMVLEGLCAKLQASTDSLKLSINNLRREQMAQLKPYILELRTKKTLLVEQLNQTRQMEDEKRDKLNNLSHQTVRAKQTVKAANRLWLADYKKREESKNLGLVREERAAVTRELEAIMHGRNQSKQQINAINIVVKELERDIADRDYDIIHEAVLSRDFSKSVSPQLQQSLLETVKKLAQCRIKECELDSKLRHRVIIALYAVREKIALVVGNAWH